MGLHGTEDARNGRTARAEALWLEGRDLEVPEATSVALELATRRGATWVAGEMLSWRRRAGGPIAPPLDTVEPFASELAGDWQRAAELWRKADLLICPPAPLIYSFAAIA